MQEPILALQNVAVTFGALRAVDGVSLTVKQDERRAIIGPNGAGKTTLFNAITGVILASEGEVVFDHQTITHRPPHQRAALGIARTFQITNLFPSLTVQENMILAFQALHARKFSLFGKAELRPHEQEQISQALEQAGIADLSNVRVTEMSYGKQRQLEIALSIVGHPKLLLLDEPAAGLSPSERSMVADVISNLPKNLTMILIEHDMDLALGLVDYVTCLYEGKLLVEARPDEIRTNSLVQDVYLGRPHHA